MVAAWLFGAVWPPVRLGELCGVCAATRKCGQSAGSIIGGDSTAGNDSRYFRVVSASTKISVERRLASADLVALNEHRPGPSIPVTVSKCRPGFNAKVTDSAVLRWAAICSSTITPIAHLLPTAPMSRVTTTFPVEAPWSGSANTRSSGAGLTHCCVGLFGGHETTCGQQRNSDHRRSHCDLCSCGMHILSPRKSPLTGGLHLSA